ncbi:hypothetical protein ADUPG1_013586 [Aduncisulcus paluster]|uniref:Uncharacterized protein n=1 Tax=Aduncisulcus paluster TaxID=2918883 RepID=A0ABQ5K3G9_9EUKA|nr:hypothetical protein ADUPG1_013586 [Aduncisulcus paluster]
MTSSVSNVTDMFTDYGNADSFQTLVEQLENSSLSGERDLEFIVSQTSLIIDDILEKSIGHLQSIYESVIDDSEDTSTESMVPGRFPLDEDDNNEYSSYIDNQIINKEYVGVFYPDFFGSTEKSTYSTISTSIASSLKNSIANSADNEIDIYDSTIINHSDGSSTVPNPNTGYLPILTSSITYVEGYQAYSPLFHWLDQNLSIEVSARASYDPRASNFFKSGLSNGNLSIEVSARASYDPRASNFFKSGLSNGVRRGFVIFIDTKMDKMIQTIFSNDNDIIGYAKKAIRDFVRLVLSMLTTNDWVSIVSSDNAFSSAVQTAPSTTACKDKGLFRVTENRPQ